MSHASLSQTVSSLRTTDAPPPPPLQEYLNVFFSMIPPIYYDHLQIDYTYNTRTSETKPGIPKTKQYSLGYRGGQHWIDKHFHLVFFFLSLSRITRIDAQDVGRYCDSNLRDVMLRNVNGWHTLELLTNSDFAFSIL